jgi:type IV pilus assembly protein PilV
MTYRQQKREQGVMMIEVLIGILIFSIGILAMLGMQTLAMRATIDAKYRAEAGFLANEIVGVMWGDPANLANYATASCAANTRCNAWLTRVSTALPGGIPPTITVATRQVTIVVQWQGPGQATPSNHTVIAQIFRATD